VPRLVVFRGDAVENEVHLAGNTVHVGRHVRNEVVLDDALNGVSRFHAEIRAENGAYVIVDLNSRNGVWINGRRINTKAPLELGVPATVGAFELVLEDDASGAFDRPPLSQRTMVNAASPDRAEASGRTDATGRTGGTGRTDGTARPAARSRSAFLPLSAANRQILLWSGAVALVVLVCAVTFAVVRYRTRPTPLNMAAIAPPPAAPAPATTTSVPDAPPENPDKALNEQDLAAAREQMTAGQFAEALRDHVEPVLERDPENAAGLELKRQADEAVAAAVVKPVRKPKPEQPAEVETPGIPRKAGEVWADYLTRVRQVQVAFADGKSSLEKQDYAAAIARFRAVVRDQPKYQGVDALLADAVARQQKAVETAVINGQQNEQANKLLDARRWYERALEIDPASTSARERRASILSRMNTEATRLYNGATFALKAQDTAAAVRQFQQILDTMMPGDEIRDKAAKALEALKR
jgi:pSer/pThr/pTyr-binding forkhead associated (FHA) protein/tetratricopeptide (TPR) repeat protein